MFAKFYLQTSNLIIWVSWLAALAMITLYINKHISGVFMSFHFCFLAALRTFCCFWTFCLLVLDYVIAMIGNVKIDFLLSQISKSKLRCLGHQLQIYNWIIPWFAMFIIIQNHPISIPHYRNIWLDLHFPEKIKSTAVKYFLDILINFTF